MESLHQLIQSLTSAEIKGVRAELKANNVHPKLLEAFSLFSQHIDFPSLSKAYSDFKNNKKTDRHVPVLQEYILEYLISEKNITRDQSLDENFQIELKIRKKVCYMNYLFRTKKSLSLTFQLLDEIIASAKEYELYQVLIDALHNKKIRYGMRTGIKEYEKISNEITFYLPYAAALRRAEELFYDLNLWRKYYAVPDPVEYRKFLGNSIEELKALLTTVKSTIPLYYLKHIEIEYYRHIGDHNQAITVALQKIEILKSNKVIYRKERIGICYDDIAVSLIMLECYAEAADHTRMAQAYFIEASYNYGTSKGLEFLSTFYDKKYNEAMVIVQNLPFKADEVDKFREAKYVVFYSYVLFSTGKYKETLKLLSQPLELSSDKTGWAVSVRMLTIMSLVELERFEEAAQHIDSLRKHIERYSKIEVISPRTHIITNLLRTLARYGFNFHQPQLDPYLQQLRLPANAWKPLTPELIPLEQWVEQKRSSHIEE